MKNFLILFTLLLTACSQVPDFKTFPKIDAHVHLETSDDSFVPLLRDNNLRLLTLVTRSVSQPEIDKEFNYARELTEGHPGSIAFATTFSMDGFGEEDWEENTIDWLSKCFDKGAIAVKVWKDIGMTFRDSDSSFILIDDPRFDPIFDFIESRDKTLVNHNGEPKNCWLPFNEMTVRGDSNYFANNPQYHMYMHPDYPSYEDLNAARDRMLEKHPNLRYVGCHLGSLEWNVDELAKTLDRFPNMSVDMAARIVHFKVQDRDKVREFILEYQDRLLYGTDISIKERNTSIRSMERAEDLLQGVWLDDWEYFTSDKILTQDDKLKEYRSLNLPEKVLEKIYFTNASRMYPGIV